MVDVSLRDVVWHVCRPDFPAPPDSYGTAKTKVVDHFAVVAGLLVDQIQRWEVGLRNGRTACLARIGCRWIAGDVLGKR
ncbi:MAG: hypothetical protein JO100_05890 [Pseudonocardia sp.]|nr:hypothetical protein [Pseudonocardia sp.]